MTEGMIGIWGQVWEGETGYGEAGDGGGDERGIGQGEGVAGGWGCIDGSGTDHA